MKPLEMIAEASIKAEKLRVQTQVRQSHLSINGRPDKLTDELLERIEDLEKWVDKRMSELIIGHPAYPWFSKVKGIGKENIGKVVGQIDIEKCNTISALWKFCGYSVENGKAQKRKAGEKLDYNSNLRSMCYRLGTSLMRTKGVFYEYYCNEKDKYQQRYKNQGFKIVPAASLPRTNGKRYEQEGLISEGHLHNMALRKMIKLFLSCLWLVWRQMEGLPIREPYPIDKLGHNGKIDPWEMIDRQEKEVA